MFCNNHMSKSSGRKVSNQGQLPFLMINGAVSADGKLALENRALIQFSSELDRQLVFRLRAQVDAVLSGARTVETFSLELVAGGNRWRERRLRQGLTAEPMRVIVSGNATLDPRSKVFQKRVSPIIILTTRNANKKRVAALRRVADEVKIFGERTVSLTPALRWLRAKHGIRSVVCEGGGETNAALLRAGVVDELHLTICPLMLSGRHAPTISDNTGVGSLDAAPRLKLKSLKQVKGEIFLIYKIIPRR
jgi:5-amino-6-(5-phosphoribosylamino)uracil reductase